ncbi:hypothetical protein pdam_00020429, partial [Pocillopora damicornis]
LGFKAGKKISYYYHTRSVHLQKISFQYHFYDRQKVKVFATVGHTERSQNPRNGGAIWVDDAIESGFTVCVVEFRDSSKICRQGLKMCNASSYVSAFFISSNHFRDCHSWCYQPKSGCHGLVGRGLESRKL